MKDFKDMTKQEVIYNYEHRFDNDEYGRAIDELAKIHDLANRDVEILKAWEVATELIAEHFNQGVFTVCEDAGRQAREDRKGSLSRIQKVIAYYQKQN